MSCLNTKDSQYVDMELASKGQPQDAAMLGAGGPHAAPHAAPAKRGGGGGHCNLGAILGGLGLLLGVVSLILSIYAASVARRGGGGGSGAVFTSSPRGGPAGSVPVHLGAGSGYYARLPDMKYARSDFRAIPVGSSIYLLGGLTNNAPGANSTSKGRILNNVVRYDTYRELVSDVAPMPAPRSRFAAAELDGAIYVIAGMDSSAEDATPVGTVFRYDIARNTWAKLPASSNVLTPRSDSCASVMGGKIYLMGGYSANYEKTLGGEVFDPATGKWTALPEGMTTRGDTECAALGDDCVAVLGGWGPSDDFSNLAECYSPSKGSWRRLASMNRARGDFAAEVLPGNRIIVLGGESGEGKATNETAIRYVEEYIAADDVWVPKAPLPEARFRFDAAHVNNQIYILGGQPTCSNQPDDPQALGRQACGNVALNSSWGFFDSPSPDLYVWTKQA